MRVGSLCLLDENRFDSWVPLQTRGWGKKSISSRPFSSNRLSSNRLLFVLYTYGINHIISTIWHDRHCWNISAFHLIWSIIYTFNKGKALTVRVSITLGLGQFKTRVCSKSDYRLSTSNITVRVPKSKADKMGSSFQQ